MARITIKEAVAISPVSESTLRRDIKSGKVSSEKDERGRRRIDTSELVRVYGQLTHSTQANDQEMNAVDTPDNRPENSNDTPDTANVDPKIIMLKDNQIADLQKQLEKAETQLEIATTEKSQLLDLLSAEKEEKRELKTEMKALMPPPDDKPKSRNWFHRLVGAR